MPVYNVASKIEKTLISLTQQDYDNFEIIVVNDASTDSTETIAKDILSKSGVRFRIITHEINLGVSAARNTGLKAATGKYIWFVDGDDLADREFLKSMCGVAEMKDADMAFCAFTVYYEQENKYKNRPIKLKHELKSSSDYFKAYMTSKIPSGLWCCVFRKDFLDESAIKFREGCHFGEDTEFLLKAFVASDNTCFVNKMLYTYVIHERVLDSFKPDRKMVNAQKQSATACWRTCRYVLRHAKSEREKSYALNFYLPESIIRSFTSCARNQDKSHYDRQAIFLKHKKVRELLLSTLKMIIVAPEMSFKALMLLFFPNLYYFMRRYL